MLKKTINKKKETRRKQRCVIYIPRPSSSMIIRDLSLAFYEKEALLYSSYFNSKGFYKMSLNNSAEPQ